MARTNDHGPFPFLSAAAGTFDFFRANARSFLVAAWAWVLMSSFALIGWVYGLNWLMAFDLEFAAQVGAWSPRFRELIFTIPPALVQTLSLAVIAVTWHRLFILSEPPRGLVPFHPQPVALYIGRTLLLFAIIGLMLLLSGVVLIGIVGQLLVVPSLSFLIMLVPLAVMFFGVFAMLRSGLAMPAAAVSDPKWTLERSWHETDGNGLRLLAGMLIVALPVYIGNTVIALTIASTGGVENPLMFMLAIVLANAFAAAGAALTAGYYSRAYVFFTAADAMDRPPVSHFT
jgi:hypothetical protein